MPRASKAKCASEKRKRRQWRWRRNSRAKYTIVKLRYKCKRKQLPFNLTEEWLLEKLEPFKCELTSVPFYKGEQSNHPRAWSVDRINPTRGYTRNNCRIVTHQMNVALNEFGEQSFADLAFAYVARSLADRASQLSN